MKTFSKGDLLIFHLSDEISARLLVVHVVKDGEVYYCWDRDVEVYRLIYNHPTLHLLCPEFDPDFPSDVDWTNEWVIELYMRKYRLSEMQKSK